MGENNVTLQMIIGIIVTINIHIVEVFFRQSSKEVAIFIYCFWIGVRSARKFFKQIQ